MNERIVGIDVESDGGRKDGIEGAAVGGEGHGGARWLVPPPGMNTGAPGFITNCFGNDIISILQN